MTTCEEAVEAERDRIIKALARRLDAGECTCMRCVRDIVEGEE